MLTKIVHIEFTFAYVPFISNICSHKSIVLDSFIDKNPKDWGQVNILAMELVPMECLRYKQILLDGLANKNPQDWDWINNKNQLSR